MIYLFYGSQLAVIEQEARKVIKEELPEVNDFSLIRFDLTETPIQDIVDDALTMPFGVDKKVIVVKNSYIFTKNAPKKDKIEHDISSFIKYLDHPNPMTTIIFMVDSTTLDDKSELVKAIKNKVNIKKTVNVDDKDWPLVIKQMITKREMKFEPTAIDEFVKRVSGDLKVIKAELDKLECYGGKITKDVVCNLVARPLEDKMFGMVDSMLYNKPDQTIAIYDDLRTQNEDPATLVTALANQFRFLYQVRYLSNSGKNADEIGEELGVRNQYRISFSLKKTMNISEGQLLGILDELASLDYQIKSGQVDKFQAFECFMIRPR